MTDRAVNPAVNPEDVVLRWLDAVNHRDLEQLLELSDDEVDLHPLRLAGFEARYQGRHELCRWVGQLSQLSPEQQIQAGELRRVRDDEVVAIGALTLGLNELVLGPFAGLHRVVDGRIVVARHYLSDPELIEQLGLI